MRHFASVLTLLLPWCLVRPHWLTSRPSAATTAASSSTAPLLHPPAVLGSPSLSRSAGNDTVACLSAPAPPLSMGLVPAGGVENVSSLDGGQGALVPRATVATTEVAGDGVEALALISVLDQAQQLRPESWLHEGIVPMALECLHLFLQHLLWLHWLARACGAAFAACKQRRAAVCCQSPAGAGASLLAPDGANAFGDAGVGAAPGQRPSSPADRATLAQIRRAASPLRPTSSYTAEQAPAPIAALQVRAAAERDAAFQKLAEAVAVARAVAERDTTDAKAAAERDVANAKAAALAAEQHAAEIKAVADRDVADAKAAAAQEVADAKAAAQRDMRKIIADVTAEMQHQHSEMAKVAALMYEQKLLEASIQHEEETAQLEKTLTGECVLCLDLAPTFALLPCGHRCLCQACVPVAAAALLQCPMCRDPVTSTVRIWV